MSIVELLHQARKARLKRIASRAVAQTPSAATTIVPGRIPSRHGAEREYERAWAVEILGVTELPDVKSAKPRVDDIQCAVARHYHIRRDDLLATRKTHDVLRPRQVAMYLAKQLTSKSFPEIARCFGRDHTTVLYAARRVAQLLERDGELAADIARIRKMLED